MVDFNHLRREDEELSRSQTVQFTDAGIYAVKPVLIWNIGGDRSFIDFLWAGCYEYVVTDLTDKLRLHLTTQEKSFQWELSILVLFVVFCATLYWTYFSKYSPAHFIDTVENKNDISSLWLGKEDSIEESNYSKIFERKEKIIRPKIALIKDKDWINWNWTRSVVNKQFEATSFWEITPEPKKAADDK